MTLLTKLYSLVGIVAAIFLFGTWEHHKGYQECKADYEAEKVKLEKESKDAIKAEHDQADSDKQLIADYYGRLLSARTKLPSGGIQACGTQGVCPATSQCVSTDGYLQLSERCAEDAAKLVRVKYWIESLNLKTE